MKKTCGKNYFAYLLILLLSILFTSCYGKKDVSNLANITELGTTDTNFLEQTYVIESIDFALYEAWIKLDSLLLLKDSTNYLSDEIQKEIKMAQSNFLQELEREKQQKTYNISVAMYGIQNQLREMEIACKNLDSQELSRLITAFYISKGLVYQKSGTVFMQLIVSMGLLLFIIMGLLFFYRFTYVRRIEIEKILKATNKGQEEERRRLALELHDSVAQQMRYVSILAEKVSDKELSKEIRENQSECIENIRNACYTLSSIDMDKGGFIEILRISVENFQKRTGISTSLVITDDVNFDLIPKTTFHHLFRIIMELLSNIEKHSGATEVTILIRSPLAGDKIHEGLVIFVTDDGNGVDEKILRAMNSKNVTSIKNQHFGLQNIKLRLNEIGGTIKYFSEKGEGTEVRMRIGK